MDAETLALSGALASTVMCVTMHVSFWDAMRRKRSERVPPHLPPVSVLKPISGLDGELAKNLESFAAIAYPRFELLLGFASRDDAALPTARAFLAAHPKLCARVVFTDPNAALNPKVAQLMGLARAASFDVLLVSDANVRVRPSYLVDLVRELREGVGLVSSLVCGDDESSLAAALESAQLDAFVAPGIVSARAVTKRTVTVGKSMMLRRVTLQQIGGFAAVGDVLAEDDVLGQLVSRAGYAVALSLVPVRNPSPEATLRTTYARHTRWAKLRRAMAPVRFGLEPIVSPAVVGALLWLASPTGAVAKAWVLATLVQCALATISVATLRGRRPSLLTPALEVLRAYLLAACWAAAWVSRRVEWRGHELRIASGTRLVPLAPPSGRAVSVRGMARPAA